MYQILKTVYKHGGGAKETFKVANGNQCLSAVLQGVAPTKAGFIRL